MPLEHVDVGWVWLKDKLDQIIDEVNRNKPLASSTIAVDSNTSGTLIRVVGANTSTSTGGGGGGEVWPAEVGWRLMAVIDNSSGNCVTKYIYYWGTVPASTPGAPPSMPSSG